LHIFVLLPLSGGRSTTVVTLLNDIVYLIRVEGEKGRKQAIFGMLLFWKIAPSEWSIRFVSREIRENNESSLKAIVE